MKQLEETEKSTLSEIASIDCQLFYLVTNYKEISLENYELLNIREKLSEDLMKTKAEAEDLEQKVDDVQDEAREYEIESKILDSQAYLLSKDLSAFKEEVLIALEFKIEDLESRVQVFEMFILSKDIKELCQCMLRRNVNKEFFIELETASKTLRINARQVSDFYADKGDSSILNLVFTQNNAKKKLSLQTRDPKKASRAIMRFLHSVRSMGKDSSVKGRESMKRESKGFFSDLFSFVGGEQ